jgi:hypothetical protein
MRLQLILACVFICITACAAGKIANVSNIRVVEFGLADGLQFWDSDAENTSLGYVHDLYRPKVIKQTNIISADLGTRFGVTFIVDGNPIGGKAEITVKVIHPSIRNPKSNKDMTVDQWSNNSKIGKNYFAGWGFDYDWELVPGDWIIEL